MLKFTIILALIGAINTQSSKVHPSLLDSFKTKSEANIIINFVGGNKAVLNSIENQAFTGRTDRLITLQSALERHAQKSQENVQKYLTSKSINFRSFWISNLIFIKGATIKLVEALEVFQEVTEIREEEITPFPTTIPSKRLTASTQDRLVEWGIARIQADEAWKITNGSGVVIAYTDSGVRYSHVALRDNWRSEYGWFDPFGQTEFPHDPNSHGTHCMGSLVGNGGIGVSPGSQWISCSVCGSRSCSGISDESILACGEWILCPTKPDGSDRDCSKAPALVSNSWGISKDKDWFEDVTNAWVAGGIIPFFAIRNHGVEGCGSAGSPGDYKRVIGVGSTDIENYQSGFSSMGPGPEGRIKPDISAPGEEIRSCVPDSDTSYGIKSGTSMSTPHAAGVAALLLSLQPNLTYDQVYQALIDGVDHNLESYNETCGGRHDTEFPNNHFGYGLVNALKVVENAQKALKN